VKAKLAEQIGYDIERLRQKTLFQGIYKYISFFYGQRTTLADYFPPGSIVILDEPSRLVEGEASFVREEEEWLDSMLKAGEFLPEMSITLPLEGWKERLKKPII